MAPGSEEAGKEEAEEGKGGPEANQLLAASPCFIRGDADSNGAVNVTDAVFLLQFLFQGGPTPGCLDAADSDDVNEKVDLTDGVNILNFLFRGFGAIPAPYPSCGLDPTADAIGCDTASAACDSDDDGLNDCDEDALGTDPTKADTDGDGFTDGEEVLETGVDGLKLSGEPLFADPLRKDIYVEIDWMVHVVEGQMGHTHRPCLDVPPEEDDIGHTHQPCITALQTVCDAFHAKGITLHLDVGSEGLAPFQVTAQNKARPFNLGEGGTEILHTIPESGSSYSDFVSDIGSDANQLPFWQKFEIIKAANMGPNRTNVFRYNLWCHRQFPNDGQTSGLAQTVFKVDGQDGKVKKFSDDFVVSFGAPSIWPTSLSDLRSLHAAVFMHELGHALTLRHGGDVDLPAWKPNYFSVMSNRYALHGFFKCFTDVGFGGKIDYSSGEMMTLNSTMLDENVGFGPLCGDAPIDWNRNCTFDAKAVSSNIICTPKEVPFTCPHQSCKCPTGVGCSHGFCFGNTCCTQLTDHNDWLAIDLNFNFISVAERSGWLSIPTTDECTEGAGAGLSESPCASMTEVIQEP
jgi:hypothetical protein